MLILIADDDRLARYALKSMLRDLDDGSFIISEVTNGKTLVAQCSRLQPDVAFVDIDMPQMDGLSAIEACQQVSRYTQFVVASGYTEFGYARKSISLHVADYLVKPVEQEQLEQVLRRLRQHLVHTRSRINMDFQVKAAQLLRLWEEIGYAESEDPAAGISGAYHGFVFLLDARPNSNAYPQAYLTLTEGLHRLGRQCEQRRIPWILWDTRDACLEFIVHCKPDAYQEIQTAVERLCVTTKNTAVSCLYARGSDLWTLFQNAGTVSQQTCYRFGLPAGQVIHPELDPLGQTEQQFLNAAEELVDAFQEANESRYEKAFHEMKQLKSCGKIDGTRLAELMCICMDGHFVWGDLRRLQQDLEKHKKHLYVGSGLVRSDKISHAVEFMEKHYMQDISVAQLAERLDMTPNYFSKLFHEGTGQTFSAYLSMLRINQAKRILSTRLDIPVKDIALMVGYFSSRHFSKVFKNLTGVSPSEFREQIVGKGE